MTVFINLLIGFGVIAHAGLLFWTLARRGEASPLTSALSASWWLLLVMAAALLTNAFLLLPPERPLWANLTPIWLVWSGNALTLAAYGALLMSDLRLPMSARLGRVWALSAALWLIALTLTPVLSGQALRGWLNWLEGPLGLNQVVLSAGLIWHVLFLLGVSLYAFYRATLPELANRALFWTGSTLLMLTGLSLIGGGDGLLAFPGVVLLLITLASLLHAALNYRLFDVRTVLIHALRLLSLTLITWVLTFGALYLVNRVAIADGLMGVLILAALALLVTVVFLPIRQVLLWLFDELEPGSRIKLATAIAEYSRQMARANELDQVVQATNRTLGHVLGIRRSVLILVNTTGREPETLDLLVLDGQPHDAEHPHRQARMSQKSPLYEAFAVQRAPLLQYDMEYGPVFADVPEDEKHFFRSLNMRAYVPVVAENQLMGLLACGPKRDDLPFYPREVEMLLVIGHQVGTALRSARLIDDLRHLNTSMRMLNRRLEVAKEELEKLDSVKTDFVTIASHELRTPLAQIRGYTDILDSMNQQKLLDEDQAQQMVANLRKSAERMEELISAMLDVSQLDVNSMDLRFVRAKPSTVIRLALEPLQDALQQRNLQVKQTGLEDMPPLRADMQRLVQAFRNVLVNAIKFTPDGGHINLEAHLQPAKDATDSDRVLFMIEDTGIGIKRKDLPYIFQKFYRGFDTQLHSSGIYKFLGAGPGLGLTIARGIIDGHGGQIWAESSGQDLDEPPGSTFYVLLPVHPPEDASRVLSFDSHNIKDETRETSEIRTITPEQEAQYANGQNQNDEGA